MNEDDFNTMIDAMTTAAIDKIPTDHWHNLGDHEQAAITKAISEAIADALDDAFA